MLRLGAEREEVAVVDDQRGSPTFVGHLAAATRRLLEQPYGVWHVAAAGDCTWADFAEAIFEEALGLSCRVRRISSAELGPPRSAPCLLSPPQREAGRAGVAPLARWPARDARRHPGWEAGRITGHDELLVPDDLDPRRATRGGLDAIYAIERWPDWWPGVKRVEKLESGATTVA